MLYNRFLTHFQAMHFIEQRAEVRLVEAAYWGRVAIWLCRCALTSPGWFPLKVSERSFRKPLGECVPLSLGEGKREHQRVGPDTLLEKLGAEAGRGLNPREATMSANSSSPLARDMSIFLLSHSDQDSIQSRSLKPRAVAGVWIGSFPMSGNAVFRCF